MNQEQANKVLKKMERFFDSLDPESQELFRKQQTSHMYWTSLPIKSWALPPIVYHVAPRSARKNIMQEGLKPHRIYGAVNTCEHIEECEMFTKGDVWAIDTTQLEEKWRLSQDHNKDHFPFEVYAYYGTIPKNVIKRVTS